MQQPIKFGEMCSALKRTKWYSFLKDQAQTQVEVDQQSDQQQSVSGIVWERFRRQVSLSLVSRLYFSPSFYIRTFGKLERERERDSCYLSIYELSFVCRR